MPHDQEDVGSLPAADIFLCRPICFYWQSTAHTLKEKKHLMD